MCNRSWQRSTSGPKRHRSSEYTPRGSPPPPSPCPARTAGTFRTGRLAFLGEQVPFTLEGGQSVGQWIRRELACRGERRRKT